MAREGCGLESSRTCSDQVDGGNIRWRLHLDVNWVDGGSNTQHGHKQLMPGSGNTAAADVGVGAGTGEAARHSWLGEDDGNHNGEDDAMMRNNLATKEGAW